MILLKEPIIITMDARRSILFGKSILIKGNKIAAIAEEKTLRKRHDFRNCKVIDCRHKIALPGLINAHTHVAMSLFRGMGHAGRDHIYKLMFPIERELTGQDVYRLARLGILEMLKGGTTCFADHYYFISEVAKAAKEFGLRAVLGHTLMDMHGPHLGRKEFHKALQFVERFSKDELIKPCIAPHATETISPAYLKRIIQEARRQDLVMHMHVAQTKVEYDYARKVHKKTPVKYLLDIGAFQSRFLAAHCIYVTQEDIGILARNNVNVAVTPSSEIIFEKLPPVSSMSRAGINLALGTDCVATADSMSPLHEMKKAFYSLVQAHPEEPNLRAVQMLEMFTINAAKALGLEDKIGSLEEAKLADILIMDAQDPALHPVYDIATNLVLCSQDSMVDVVIVNGRIVFRDKQAVGAAAGEIVRSAIRCSRRIMTSAFGHGKTNREVWLRPPVLL